jgi:hypothetical protein
VERLLLDLDLSYNSLTLLAPGGITLGGMASQYTEGAQQAACGVRVRLG